MEPLNCAVRLADGRCEIWTGTQFQTMDQMSAARIAGVPQENVSIHTQFLGGGFGRRATPASDFVSEAVHGAKAAGGPVKTVWAREDGIRGGGDPAGVFPRGRGWVCDQGPTVRW